MDLKRQVILWLLGLTLASSPLAPAAAQVFDLGQMQAPVRGNQLVVPPISFVDVNRARFGKLEIDLTDAEFPYGRSDNLHMKAVDFDLEKGRLKSLEIDLKNGKIQDFNLDRLTISTEGELSFDSGSLLYDQVLQFHTPAEAVVYAEISQTSLNNFLNAPRTLDRMSISAHNHVPLLGQIIGNQVDIGLKITGGNLELKRKDEVALTLATRLGMGEMAVAIPVSMETKLGLADGWVHLSDTRILTAGQEISPELSRLLVERINALSNWGRNSPDIRFTFKRLRVVPGKKFVLEGTAQIQRLRFGSISRR